ncbi:MAG: hydrogenase maturation protease [Anaerolineae bacterium]
MHKILLIAYGNPSRRDDGLAYHVLEHLRELLYLEPIPLLELADGELIPGLEVIYTQQLVPELSENLAEADTVVFIDAHVAAVDWQPVHWQEISARYEAGMVTHHFKPDTLLAWSSSLYGKAPQAFILSVLGVDFDFGYELSPETSQLVIEAAKLLADKLSLPTQSI